MDIFMELVLSFFAIVFAMEGAFIFILFLDAYLNPESSKLRKWFVARGLWKVKPKGGGGG